MTLFTVNSILGATATPMTREGVGCPSRLSSNGQKAHYQNRNAPRELQRINRARKAAGKPVIYKDGRDDQY